MAWLDWLDTAGEWIGKGLDWLGDNEELVDIVTRLAYDHPDWDPEQLMQFAIQEAIINSPDIRTPSGSVTWEVDPETGKRKATQAYTPEIQALFDALVQRAGDPTQVYQNPEMMGETFLGQLMGQPDYQRPDFYRPGVEMPSSSTAPGGTPGTTPNRQDDILDPEDPDHPLNQPPGEARDPSGNPVMGGGLHPGNLPGGLDGFANHVRNSNYAPGTSFNEIVNDYFGGLEGSNPGALERFMAEHGDDLGRVVGLLAEIPGLGWLGEKFQDWYWSDNQWQNPMEGDQYRAEPNENMIGERLVNNPRPPSEMDYIFEGVPVYYGMGSRFYNPPAQPDPISGGQGYWDELLSWMKGK